MVWTARKLVYRARSPIHIGCYTLGYIKLTRSYIPGQALWGAATALLTRAYGSGIDDYEKFGALLKEKVIFSYFYPAINPDNPPLYPLFTEEGLAYGDIPEAQFHKMFIGSTTQTAIAPDSNTKTDESLHESEYILPKIIEGKNVKDVFFVGYVFIKDGVEIDGKRLEWKDGDYNLTEALKTIFIGGDIKYGWGHLEMYCSSKVTDQKIFECELKYADEDILLEVPENKPIPAHLDTRNACDIRGDIEPLIGRRWSKDGRGAGQDTPSHGLFWMPGSVLNTKATLAIAEYGVLK